jgi:hypothetical protein
MKFSLSNRACVVGEEALRRQGIVNAGNSVSARLGMVGFRLRLTFHYGCRLRFKIHIVGISVKFTDLATTLIRKPSHCSNDAISTCQKR